TQTCTRPTLQEVRYAAACRATETTITEPGPDVSVFMIGGPLIGKRPANLFLSPHPQALYSGESEGRKSPKASHGSFPRFFVFIATTFKVQRQIKKARHPLRRSYKSIRSSYEERLRRRMYSLSSTRDLNHFFWPTSNKRLDSASNELENN